MTNTKRALGSVSQFLIALGILLLALPSWADSQARIVRLSSVDGNVKIDRNTDQGFENAITNLPITQGVKLQTGNDGRAEVEFEDGSTLRLAPGTSVEFPQLSLRDSGAKVSAVTLSQGTAYLDLRPEKDNDHEFTLNVGRESMDLTRAVHLRVQVSEADTTLAVFKGEVEVESPSGRVKVGKNEAVTFDLANHDQYPLANEIPESPFDDWDKEQGKYHDRYLAKNSYSNNSSYAGVSDLNYYGNYFNAPGYGMLWQPYFVGAGWDPFMDGAWAYYPGYGYTWVSAYPWGWAPYHCGSWMYGQSFGWAWQPGAGRCSGWSNFPRIVNPPSHFHQPQPPVRGTSGNGTIIVTRRPLTPARELGSKIRIENDSAGLGIPRGAVRDMPRISQEAKQNGVATTNIRVSPVVRMPMPANNTTSAPRATPPRPATQPATTANPPKPRMSPPSSPKSTGSFGGGASTAQSRSNAPAPRTHPK